MKISLVIPCYNVADYVQGCFDSIAKSAEHVHRVGEEIEVIFIDDGSTDDTGLIISCCQSHRCSSLNLIVKVLSQNNSGVAAARNRAIEAATGDWLMFVDGDDVVSPQFFSDVFAAIKKFPEADLIRFGTSTFADGSKPEWKGTGEISLVETRRSLPAAVCMFGFTEMAYRASKFRPFRFKGYRLGEDLVYTARCFSIADSIAVVDRTNYGYRIRRGSRAHGSLSVEKMRDQIDYLREMFEIFQKCGKDLPLTITRGRGNVWLEVCPTEILQHGKADDAWRNLWGYWLASLEDAKRIRFFSVWQRSVIIILRFAQCQILAQLLCSVPLWLKRKGLHR